MKYTGINRKQVKSRSDKLGLKGLLCLATLTIAMILTTLAGTAEAIQNSASGNNNGIALDMTNATVTLNRGGYPEGGFVIGDTIPATEIIQATDGSGIITINWRGRDGQSDSAALKNFEYSINGGFSWSAPTNGDLSTSLSVNWDDNGGARWSTATTFAAATSHSFSFNTKDGDVTGIDVTDQSDIRIRFTLNDGVLDAINPTTSEDFRVDDLSPINTITGASYSSISDTMTITGTNFTSIAAAATDINNYVDWTKLVWDINGDNAISANITFVAGDISSLTVANDTTLTLLFTGAKAVAIEAMADYGLAGGADSLDITAGFSIDAFGNAAATDGLADGPLTTIDPNVKITESGGSTDIAEGGSVDSYSVVLDSLPSDTVTVTVTPDGETDLGAGTATAIVLSFTTGDWNIAQAVTVTAVDDVTLEGPHTSTITHTAASTDAGYNGLAINSVTANITDNEAAPSAASTVTVNPDVVVADGASSATVTVRLIDSLGQPIPGKTISLLSSRGATDFIVQPLAPTDANGVAVGVVNSNSIGVATITATDVTDSIILIQSADIFFNQGEVLELTKEANKDEAGVGDIVTYRVSLSNTKTTDIVQVSINDAIPPAFKYIKGSTRMNGATISDPAGNRILTFDMGTVPALVDGNGNGKADPGEPGYMEISYQLIIGSGATPGDYTNSAVATDLCSRCYISNRANVDVRVALDPIFDLGTIIGKVFEDMNSDGYQDAGETGVAGAMVVLDDGSYVLTDEYGRYHFPVVKPGQRVIKLNLGSLPDGTFETTDLSKILSVTPGLLVKANFGVNEKYDKVSIGRPKEHGLKMIIDDDKKPLHIMGNSETLTLLINGQMAHFPTNDVRMRVDNVDDVVEIKNHRLEKPVEFAMSIVEGGELALWKLLIINSKDEVVRTIQGEGYLPEVVLWDGKTDEDIYVKGGEIYHYQTKIEYRDGTSANSARRTFGVNLTSTISLNLTGGAFKTGSTALSSKAKRVLKETAKALRKFPDEKVVIEGHTDSSGRASTNLKISKKRAEAARDYLVNEEGISEDRFFVKWFGEGKPVASNYLPEGRELNRRVEIKGEMMEVDRAKLMDQYRTQPLVKINGSGIKTDKYGRFMAHIDDEGTESLEINVMNRQGRAFRADQAMPKLEIIEPKSNVTVAYGEKGELFMASSPDDDGSWADGGVVLCYTLLGETDPDNQLEFDGEIIPLDESGRFSSDLKLKLGDNIFGFLVKNREGYTRITELKIKVSNKDEEGNLVIAVDPVPSLSLKLPVDGVPLKSQLYTVSGWTDPVNRVYVNGDDIKVQPDGAFATTLKLPKGKSRVIVEAVDREGYRGRVEREVEFSENQLFFLAFADGKMGELRRKGYIQGAGSDKSSEFYTEGRIAYYLKGLVAGKYLITSALDTGTQEFDNIFKDLDKSENEELLTNLDPDKLYPVYGDSGSVVHDAQSSGKFYLSIESDELDAIVGNYQLNVNDTELASYQRTFFGGKVMYRSASKTAYGDHDTTILLFGAETRQVHVQDELRATGGSLYYMSHDEIIEGSEQVTLVVKDKNTGLVLNRTEQQQNLDYSIKYGEGRILFNRPLSSVSQDDRLIDANLLGGNPVYIEVDYESRVDSFEKSASGGRVRQQLGDHLALGSTYISDELTSGEYELKGVDAEIKLGKKTRLVAEISESSGAGSTVYLSEDGGLTYSEHIYDSAAKGRAWKVGAKLDLGEWFNRPDRLSLGGYMKEVESGFLSGGNFMEEGKRWSGINAQIKATGKDDIHAAYEHEELIDPQTAPAGSVTEKASSNIRWAHKGGKWTLTGEYSLRESLDSKGAIVDETSYGAARLAVNLTEGLKTSIEHQSTIDGPENDQSTLSLEYRLNSLLSFNARGTKGTSGEAAEGGAVLTLNRDRLYLKKRVADDLSGVNDSTIAGAERDMGNNSKTYTEYQWINTDKGGQSVSLVGAKKEWDIAHGFKMTLSGENSHVNINNQSSRRYSMAGGLSYSGSSGLKASTKNEVRREQGDKEQEQYLTVNRVDFKLGPDFTLMTRYRYSITKDLDLREKISGFNEAGLGIAYRPVEYDRFNALMRYTHLSDERPLSLSAIEREMTSADVASAEWSYDVTRHLEWVGKQALKVKEEETESRTAIKTHTSLTIQRLNWQVMEKTYLGMEYRILKQEEALDQREGWLMEAAWKAAKHLRIGAGYNFTDFSDNEFSDNNYSVYGWFMRLQSKY